METWRQLSELSYENKHLSKVDNSVSVADISVSKDGTYQKCTPLSLKWTTQSQKWTLRYLMWTPKSLKWTPQSLKWTP